MSEEADDGVGLIVTVDKHRSDEGGVREAKGQRGPTIDQSTVMMTGKEFLDRAQPVSEVGESRTTLVEGPISSPLGSFQSLHSSQSSEKEK